MISKKTNYNKKIAPFKYDEENKEYIPANINVSIALRYLTALQTKVSDFI